MIIPFGRRGLPLALSVAAAAGGTLVALHYHQLDLTLSHYDARGHLIVARRIIDSITPGWQQIGAVWLPLPHLLNALPVQIDSSYRSGASGVAISVASFALATGSLAWMAIALTGSAAAGVAAAAVFALNPNVLYLQATPMTEPLLIGLATFGAALLVAWCQDAAARRGDARRWRARAVGLVLALACLTRYEAWPIAACALAAALYARWRSGLTPSEALRAVAPIAMYPVAAILGFVVFSRVVVGEWFVSSGFFVPDNIAQGRPLRSAIAVWWGTHRLSGYGLITAGAIGLLVASARALRSARHTPALIAASLAASAALPFFAFLEGHPFRIRYMVPLIAAEAIGAGLVVGHWVHWGVRGHRARVSRLALVLVLGLAAFELRPLDAAAPMLVEAQSDRPGSRGRRAVTACLRQSYGGETIMASMGSLGHYMQELAHEGFDLRDFLHEGNGDIWLQALHGARPFVGWILIEEAAEGGDMLAQLAGEEDSLLAGFSRVCEGGGVALYRRRPPHPQSSPDQ